MTFRQLKDTSHYPGKAIITKVSLFEAPIEEETRRNNDRTKQLDNNNKDVNLEELQQRNRLGIVISQITTVRLYYYSTFTPIFWSRFKHKTKK